MLRRRLSPATKLSDVAEKARCEVTSMVLPGIAPATLMFIKMVSPGAGGSDRLRKAVNLSV